MAHSSGSEALDSAYAQDLLMRLCVLSEVPDTRMSVVRRARVWSQIAELAGEISETASGLARLLVPESGGGAASK
jgi:hypothetical protein